MLHKKWLLMGSFFVLVLVSLQALPGIPTYIAERKHSASEQQVQGTGGETRSVFALAGSESSSVLLSTITEEAAKRKVAPINAKIDPVWKAIPGYNGLEVDIEETLKLANHGISPNQIHYVMKEIEPSIQLKDLGPSPVYKGNPKKPMAAFMINVAWGNEYLTPILDTLRKENVHATFFLDGTWLRKNPDMAKQILSEGHELSNHAYSHKDMRTISRSKAVEEISKTEELLKPLGVKNTLFAPPSGYFSQETVQVASEFKLQTVLWTFDTIDWKNPGADRILQRLSSNVEPGTLILMHPTSSSRDALQGMIKIIKNKGLTLGTVSDVLSSKRIPTEGQTIGK